jgi:hypothetical protein
MILDTPGGSPWALEDGPRKLALRGGLPGARVFDLAAASLRKAKGAGLTTLERLPLALPASWCVNSPADSRVIRRWTLAPQRQVWIALVEMLEERRSGSFDAEEREALFAAIPAIAPEPRGVEAVSKALALLVPEAVPLMPAPAVTFLLGASAPLDAASFIAVLDWFRDAVERARSVLDPWAAAYADTTFDAAQVLDRLLWFDSEGHRHFPAK